MATLGQQYNIEEKPTVDLPCFGVIWWERTARLNKQCPGRKIWVGPFGFVCPLVRSTLKSGVACLEGEELMFWCSWVGADRPPKEAMPVATACLEQEDLGFGALGWEWKVICAEKTADGGVPLPARSGYIS
jgi:hypothetical protein